MTDPFDTSPEALRARAQHAAQEVADQVADRATRVVDARIAKQPAPTPQVPQSRALMPSAATQESSAMEQKKKDAEGPLGFLSVAAPTPERTDDAQLVATDAWARRDKEAQARRKAEAEASAALKAELESAKKTQLQKLRQVVLGELRVADDDAIYRLLARITRLVIRVLSAGQVVMQLTEAERRVLVTRHTLEQIDAELQRRTDDAVNGPPKAQARIVQAQTVLIPMRIVRAHDARQQLHDEHDDDADAEPAVQHKHERNTK